MSLAVMTVPSVHVSLGLLSWIVSYYWYVRCRSPVGLRCHLFTLLDPVSTVYHYESPFQLGVADGVIWIYYWDLSFVLLVCDRIVVLFMGKQCRV